MGGGGEGGGGGYKSGCAPADVTLQAALQHKRRPLFRFPAYSDCIDNNWVGINVKHIHEHLLTIVEDKSTFSLQEF